MSSFQESQVDHPWCGALSVEPDPGRGGCEFLKALHVCTCVCLRTVSLLIHPPGPVPLSNSHQDLHWLAVAWNANTSQVLN